MESPVSVTKTSSLSLESLLARLRNLQGTDILVGIPQDKAPRKNDSMNNATLASILTDGSALHHLPPRPFLVPGIQRASQLIAKNIGLAAKASIEGDTEKAKKYMQRAGQIGANSVKKYILEGNNVAPNAPSTIRQKGSSVPLVDEAQMVKAITYVLRESGVEMPKEEVKKTTSEYGLDGKIKTTEEGVPEVAEVGEVGELAEIAEVAAIL